MILGDIRSFVIRHRFAIRDISLLLAALGVLAYVVFAIDLFENEAGIDARSAVIELDEALLLGTLLACALFAFGARQYLRQKREFARRLATEREVRKLAYQDVLTGLPNRRRFDDALRAALDAPPRADAAHAVLLLDLNGFKRINDVHGHGAGDEVLITKRGRPVARLIRVEDSDRQAVDAAIAGLRDARVTTSLGGLDWKALRDEGRR